MDIEQCYSWMIFITGAVVIIGASFSKVITVGEQLILSLIGLNMMMKEIRVNNNDKRK